MALTSGRQLSGLCMVFGPILGEIFGAKLRMLFNILFKRFLDTLSTVGGASKANIHGN